MLSINHHRFLNAFEALAAITERDSPYTRRAFTETYLRGRTWLRQQMESAGLQVQLDEAANLVGRLPGQSCAESICLGSHTDTVSGGGRYDGVLGVLAGIELAHTLRDQGIQLRHRLEVVDFLSEEPSDYGPSCVGSRAWSGTLTTALLQQKSAQGESLAEAIVRMGGRPEACRDRPLRRPGEVAAFLELHIEQGPLLDLSRVSIGVVSGIVQIERYVIDVLGQADHAGTTPMSLRKDALVAASRVVQAVYLLALEHADRLVATVGKIEVLPNAANVVPGRVRLDLEVRAQNPEDIHGLVESVRRAVGEVEQAMGVAVRLERLSQSQGVSCAPLLQDTVRAAAAALGQPTLTIVSGAGHDAAHMAKLCPIGMVFVPSVGGRSHVADEFTRAEHLVAGADVLLAAVLDLDKRL